MPWGGYCSTVHIHGASTLSNWTASYPGSYSFLLSCLCHHLVLWRHSLRGGCFDGSNAFRIPDAEVRLGMLGTKKGKEDLNLFIATNTILGTSECNGQQQRRLGTRLAKASSGAQWIGSGVSLYSLFTVKLCERFFNILFIYSNVDT